MYKLGVGFTRNMTNSDETDQEFSKHRSPINWLISKRRKMRRRINTVKQVDRPLHLFSSFVLFVNIIFILFAMISLTGRMLLNGVPFIDSIPLAFYILPLLIFLPKLLLDYYRSRSAPLTLVILLIVAVVFGMISTLVRGFVILVIINVVTILIVFILGRFRPNAPLRSIGRRGIAWILILNSLGLMLPVSVSLMGQFPIASTSYSESTTIFVEMPLGNFEYQFVNVTPTASIISELESSGFGVDLRVKTVDTESINRLTTWLNVLSNSSVPYRLTISSNREDNVAFDATLLGSTSLFALHYEQMLSTLENILTEFDEAEISLDDLRMGVDMRLSDFEWAHIMNLTRSVNLQGFSDLVRRSLDATASDEFTSMGRPIADVLEGRSIDLGFVVDGFVIDDLLDGDITMMEFCGLSPDVILILEADLEVDCDRSRYSEAMDGDVGEYLVHTYSVSPLVSSIRIGVAGTGTGQESIRTSVYHTVDTLANDIVIASGNGVEEIVVSSLPSILNSFGSTGLTDLHDAIESQGIVEITYTFRIFAFRAVVMTIDSFDFLMY